MNTPTNNSLTKKQPKYSQKNATMMSRVKAKTVEQKTHKFNQKYKMQVTT